MRPLRPLRLAAAALAVALLSLGLNLYLLLQMRRPERWLRPAVERLAGRVRDAEGTLRYTVRVPAGTPLSFDIPVDERFAVAVDTVIPINTVVRVPFRSPLGTHAVSLPIRARVPVRARLPLQVRHTFRLRTRTRQEIVVPLEIRLDQLPLDELLR